MQSILASYPDRNLAVYAIWLPMLPDDSRDRWRPIMTDPRVTNFWDQQRVAGRYYAGGRGYQFGAIYDFFFPYRGDAAWQDRPGGWASSGNPVIAHADKLRNTISTLS